MYDEHCLACHGAEGQGVVGPALWGSQAQLEDRGPTAADLHAFVRSAMPQHNPGSLAPEQYFDVVTYLLLQNNLVQPDQSISEDALRAVRLTR